MTTAPEDLPDWVVETPRPRPEVDPRRVLHGLPMPQNWYEQITAQIAARRTYLAEHAPDLTPRDLWAERARRWPVVERIRRVL